MPGKEGNIEIARLKRQMRNIKLLNESQKFRIIAKQYEANKKGRKKISWLAVFLWFYFLFLVRRAFRLISHSCLGISLCHFSYTQEDFLYVKS